MSRIRSIKPDWLDDELIATASSDARVLSVSLILLADDYGNGRASMVLLPGRVFPGKPPEILAKALEELARIRFVTLYEIDGQRYFSIRNWSKHQKVDKPGKPHVPGVPEKVIETLANLPEALAPDQDQDQDGKGEDSARVPANDYDRRAPTAQTVRKFYAELLADLGTFPNQSASTAQACAALTAWADQSPDPYEALQAAFLAFGEDAWAKERGYPLGALAGAAAKFHTRGMPILAEIEARKAAEAAKAAP